MIALESVRHAIRRKGTAKMQDLALLSLSRPTLFRALKALQDQGEVVRVRRGLYQLAKTSAAADSWIVALQHYPNSVLCLLSALQFHRFTTQAPAAVWLALPKGAWRKTVKYPPIRLVHLMEPSYSAGIQTHRRRGGVVRVYSAAKTVADCFKFRNRIGIDVAIEALREGWSQRHFTLTELDSMARICRVQAVMKPYVEALVA